MPESRTYNITVILLCEMLQNQGTLYKMLTSAGGILALLQDSPHVRDGASTNDEIRLKVGAFCTLLNLISGTICGSKNLGPLEKPAEIAEYIFRLQNTSCTINISVALIFNKS
jgi:hypothetical protein